MKTKLLKSIAVISPQTLETLPSTQKSPYREITNEFTSHLLCVQTQQV